MKTENKDLMKVARESLRGKWGSAIGPAFVIILITGVISAIPGIGSIISIALSGPFFLGMAMFFLRFSRGQDVHFKQIFDGFHYFGESLGTYLLMSLYILLWSLLLIVPGIIRAISYSMTFFILAENPSLKPSKVLEKSRQMMNGYKMKFFLLQLRFFGWSILCILTFGIGFLWLVPYMQVTYAKFYDDLPK